MFNTLPYNSFPASTAKFEEGKNDAIQAEIDAMKDGTNIDSFGDVETALALKANSADMETALATKTNLSNIAPTFDATSGVYEIGDKVIYEGVLYEFTSAHSTVGDWDSSEVQPVKVSELINSLESGLTNRFKTITSGSLHDITQSGTYYLTAAVTDRPAGLGGMYILSAYNDGLSVGMYVAYNNDVADKQVSIVTHHDGIWEVFDIVSTRRT